MNINNYIGTNEMRYNMAYNGRTSGFKMEYPHWHPHYEIIIMYNVGEYFLMNNSRSIVSDRPAIYIHRPYTLHFIRTKGDDEYSRSIVKIEGALAAKLSEDYADFSRLLSADFVCLYPHDDELDELHMLSEQVFAYSCGLTGKKDIPSANLYAALIMRKLALIMEDGRGDITSNRCVFYIQRVLQMMSEKLSEPITAEIMAERSGIGVAKFHKDFRSATGMTYKKYLTDLRQTRARELMETGSSIINASLETGYSSEAHFIKAFREYWGMTPGEFRSSLKN